MKILYFILLLLLASCSKDPLPITPSPIPNDSMQVLWHQKIADNTIDGFISEPLVWQDKVVFVTMFYYSNSTIQSRSQKSGELIWEQRDPLIGEANNGNRTTSIINDELLTQDWNDVLNIDLYSGNITLHDRQEAYMGPLNRINSSYLYTQINDLSIRQKESFVVRREIDRIKWDTLLTIKKDSGYTCFINPPSMYVINGDSLLLFSVGKWNFPASNGQSDFYCYSLKERKIKWRLRNVDAQGCSTIPPAVDEGKVYFCGFQTINCLDILTGKEIWKYRMPNHLEDLNFCPLLIHQGKLYVQGGNFSVLRCFDAATGRQIWQNTDSGGEAQKLHYFNGMILFNSHFYLMVVNATSGKTIWKKKSPFSGGKADFDGWVPIGINERDSVIYASDRINIMAIKIPKLQ